MGHVGQAGGSSGHTWADAYTQSPEPLTVSVSGQVSSLMDVLLSTKLMEERLKLRRSP